MNGTAAPLLYVSPGRIDAVVPYVVAGQENAQVVVSHGQDSPPFSGSVAEPSPAIFTTGKNAILNY